MFIWIIISIRCVIFMYVLSLTLTYTVQIIFDYIKVFTEGGNIYYNFIYISISILWGLFLFSFYIEKLIL